MLTHPCWCDLGISRGRAAAHYEVPCKSGVLRPCPVQSFPQHATTAQVIDNFLPDGECDALIAAASASGRMAASRVGGDDARAGQSVRTSRTLALSRDVLEAAPALQALLRGLLDRAAALVHGPQLDTAALQDGGTFVRPTAPNQLTPELPQVAHYAPGAAAVCHRLRAVRHTYPMATS
jgi:hypothetical protein